MKISVTRDGWEDYITWSNERTILQVINRMIEEAARDPAPGIGTPELLSHPPCVHTCAPSAEASGSWRTSATESTD